jgi:tetratricopeptide (TPR) repeat protein
MKLAAFRRPALALGATLLAAAAQAQPARGACGDANPDRSILACNAIIESARTDQAARAAAFGHRGQAHLAMKVLDRAVADLDEAIRLNPRLVQAYRDRAAAQMLRSQPERAVADLSEALRLAPNDAGTSEARGRAYLALRDPDHAIADFDEAIRLNPNSAQAWFDRGSAYGLKGQSGRAMQDWSQAAKLDPSVLPGARPVAKP